MKAKKLRVVWVLVGMGLAMLLSVGVLGSAQSVSALDSTDPVLVGAGDIASCASSGDEATANLLDGIPGTVYTLGDNVYESGTSTEFANCYNPLSSWGRHKARTRPSVGNHEYKTAGASGYFGYFGAAAGDPSKGYYSYPLGTWHIIVLNSMCQNVGGCGASSPMVTWLKGDLAANPSSCTLAYWHHPVFSSGAEHGNNPKMIPSWDALYAAGAEVVLSGHDHDYERFAPQKSSGVADLAGIREFVVGTGGKSHYAFGTIRANSEVRNSDTYGVLKLTLRASGYDWQFVPEAGKTFSDSGSDICHSAPPQPTDLPGPPSVIRTDPGTNATEVATTTNVTAFFSEEMMASSINTKTFKLFKKGSSTKIAAAPPTYDAATKTATLDPTSSLGPGVTYKAVVTTGAKDSVGNPLPQNYKWFFTTVR